MKIYVLMKDGMPVELPAQPEVSHHLMDCVCAVFTVASTNRRYVEAMQQALPNLLDADHGPEVYEIAEYVLTT